MVKRYDMVDMVKLIMSFLVVAIHCNINSLTLIGRLGVPFFLIASSFFFFIKYFDNTPVQKKKIVSIYVKRIFFLYLSWQIIYLPTMLKEIFIEISNSNNLLSVTILKILFGYLLYGKYDGWGPSWFLFASVYGILFILILRKIFSDISIFIIALSIEILQIIGIDFLKIPSTFLEFTFLRALIYLMIGMLIAKYYKNIVFYVKNTKFNYFVFAMIPLYIIEAILLKKYYNIGFHVEVQPLTAITASIIFLYCLSIDITIKYSKFMRRLSTFIYCSHILFIRILFPIMNINFSNRYIEWIIVSLLCVCCWIIYEYIMQKYNYKFIKYLV